MAARRWAPDGRAQRLDSLAGGGPMSRLSLFNSPLLLGFDQFERAFDRVSKAASDGYPPYNVEQTGENSLRITLAVAGIAMAGASLDNGLLNVDLVRRVVEGKVRSVEIKAAAKPSRTTIEHGTDK